VIIKLKIHDDKLNHSVLKV